MNSECPSCGAAVTFAEGVIADRCVFCDSPLVAGRADVDHADVVAPFLVARRAAADRLSAWLAGRWLAPASVRAAGAPSDLRGVLVPFWVHAATARSRWEAQVGIHWYRTETYWVTVTKDGKTTREMRTRRVQETEWFHSSGTHAASYSTHLVSGSRGLPEEEANALEPFDLGSARPYDAALLAGWVAERATIPRSEAASVARAELTAVEEQAVRRFLPGDRAKRVQVHSSIDVEPGRLALLPVWIANYTWDGAVHRLLVNGQTGEVVGSVPTSWTRLGLAIAGGIAALAFFVLFVVAVVGVTQ